MIRARFAFAAAVSFVVLSGEEPSRDPHTFLLPAPALAQDCTEVTWDGAHGDWSDGTSWSGGAEPTATHCVTIADGDTVDVRAGGKSCAALTLGAGTTRGHLWFWPGAELDVAGVLRVGDETVSYVSQLAGTVTAGSIDLPYGAYSLGGGQLHVGSMSMGGTNVIASFATNTGATVISGDLDVNRNGVVTLGGSTFTVDGTTTVGGRFSVSGNLPVSIQLNTLTVTAQGVIAPFVTSNGIEEIRVAGAVQLAGMLQVTDFSAKDGTYDVIVAGEIQGTFDSVQLPDENWAWGIEDNRVWIRRGDDTPVEATTWGSIKSDYGGAER